jgi:uncharacterized protein
MNAEAERALTEKVAFLRQPDAYAERPVRVEAIETHMSWVFLTDARAYKLKKPLRLQGSDCSTLELRKERCEAEVHLNRRLTDGVYLGITPLVRTAGGYRLLPEIVQPGSRPPETVADWLITMVRLPRDLTLEHRIRSGVATSDDAGRIAATLARFYDRAERVPWTADAYVSRLERETVRYRRELDAPRFPLANRNLLAEVTSWQLAFLKNEPELMKSRIRQGRVIDGHGDLRPEHVFLTKKPVIIDCLEFDRELRLLDAMSELSFLALECVRLGAKDLGEELLLAYVRETGDAVPRKLVTFYECHHACIRAVVALWHLDDPTVNTRSKWVRRADAYLELASRLMVESASSLGRGGSTGDYLLRQ